MNFAYFTNCDPITSKKAIKDDHWVCVIDEKNHVFEKNESLELTTIPHKKKLIGVKWLYKTKYKSIGEVDLFKVRKICERI